LKISKIFLYDEPSIPEIKISKLTEFVRDTFLADVEFKKNILSYSNDSTASQIASCRIFNTRKPYEKHSPTEEEIAFERSNVNDTSKTENIIMYDGFEIQKVFTDLIPENELTLDKFHVIFTNKLTCTYDYNDYRYHGRALIGSNPSIISTTGIIEAPAKPREYYMELISSMDRGLNLDSIKKKYQGTYLEYHDDRLSKIIEGYIMQAVFYYLTGKPFCDVRECRLYNAHWQSDLLYSQLEVCKLCEEHHKFLKNWCMT